MPLPRETMAIVNVCTQATLRETERFSENKTNHFPEELVIKGFEFLI